MSKRIVIVMMVFVVLLGCAAPVSSVETDPLDTLAASYVDAVLSGGTAYPFYTTAYDDINLMISELFTRYPVLMHYYDRGECLMYPDHMEGTLYLKNTQDSMDEIWVVGSDKELLAVLGMGLLEVKREIHFVTRDDYSITEEKIDAAIETLHDQYPVSYMGYNGRSTSWISSPSYNIQDYTVAFEYHYDLDAARLRQWRTETEQQVLYLLGNVVAQDMPDYQKVLVIHDWIINHTRYNTANLDEAGNHLAYGALVKGSCVCMGYAESGLIIFQAAGLDTYYIGGEGTNSAGDTEAHAWNAVEVDGEWYLVDMTWDDPVTTDGSDVLRYDYFLVTERQLAQDHAWDRTGLPVCDGTQWNAEKALSAYEQDGGAYCVYDASRYTTMEQARNYFTQHLTTGTEAFHGAQTGQSQVSGWFDFGQEDSVEDPSTQIPAVSEGEKGSFPWMIVILVLAALVAAGCVIGVVVVRANARRRRNRRRGDANRFSSASHVHFD